MKIEYIIGIIAFVASFIEIPKIKLNIWQILLNELNRPILTKIQEVLDISDKADKELKGELLKISNKLDAHIEQDARDKATQCRKDILDFNDKLLAGKKFSKESWAEIMRSIDKYEMYCDKHPDYRNNLCVESIKDIRENYHKRCD